MGDILISMEEEEEEDSSTITSTSTADPILISNSNSDDVNSPWTRLADMMSYELTDKMIESLSLFDFFSFGAVCVQWRRLHLEFRRRDPSYRPSSFSRFHSLPWFVPDFQPQLFDISYLTPFESMRSCNIKGIRLSSFFAPVGSAHGWLLLYYDIRSTTNYKLQSAVRIVLCLMNPISEEMINLPDSPFHDVSGHTYMPVFSPSPYFALFFISEVEHLVYLFRPPNLSWKLILFTHRILSFQAIATNFTGLLYYLSNDHPTATSSSSYDWELLVVDAYAPDPIAQMIEMDKSHIPQRQEGQEYKPYLVESNGDVLLVIQSYCYNNRKTTNNGFLVFKAEITKKKKMWVKMETLGDRVLVLDNNNTVSFSAAGVGHRVKGNCIYSTLTDERRWFEVFDMRTGTRTTNEEDVYQVVLKDEDYKDNYDRFCFSHSMIVPSIF